MDWVQSISHAGCCYFPFLLLRLSLRVFATSFYFAGEGQESIMNCVGLERILSFKKYSLMRSDSERQACSRKKNFLTTALYSQCSMIDEQQMSWLFFLLRNIYQAPFWMTDFRQLFWVCGFVQINEFIFDTTPLWSVDTTLLYFSCGYWAVFPLLISSL